MKKKLIETEWNKLCGYLSYYYPEEIKKDKFKHKMLNNIGLVKEEIRYYELKAKLFNEDLSNEEITEMIAFLTKRLKIRIEMIKSEMKRSTNKSLKLFSKDHPEIYSHLIAVALDFEDEVIEAYKTVLPIYWDFKSYLHIFLRHCKELQLEGHFSAKTKFQYIQKDIKQLLRIAIEKMVEDINQYLSIGRDFRVTGERAIYFNGNYYAIRIESNGRIDSFHPIESFARTRL